VPVQVKGARCIEYQARDLSLAAADSNALHGASGRNPAQFAEAGRHVDHEAIRLLEHEGFVWSGRRQVDDNPCHGLSVRAPALRRTDPNVVHRCVRRSARVR